MIGVNFIFAIPEVVAGRVHEDDIEQILMHRVPSDEEWTAFVQWCCDAPWREHDSQLVLTCANRLRAAGKIVQEPATWTQGHMVPNIFKTSRAVGLPLGFVHRLADVVFCKR